MIDALALSAVGVLLTALALAVTGWTAYHLLHVIGSRRPREGPLLASAGTPLTRFLVLIPAKNEAVVLSRALGSIRRLGYPTSQVRTVVVADQCADDTAKVARRNGAECLERVDGPGGKGHAIAWALDRLREDPFDAVVVLDADSVVHSGLLSVFACRLAQGHHALQADRRVLNSQQSALTRLYTLAQQLRIRAFWAVKSDRGLSSIVLGSGFCLSRQIVTDVGWRAFGIAEDWEYSLGLVRAGHRVVMVGETWVSCEEPHSYRQGYRQRLRWARGRYAVVRDGWALVRDGIASRDPVRLDAGLTAWTPNYSLLANLNIVGCALAWWSHGTADLSWWSSWTFGLGVAFLASLVGLGVYTAVGLVRLRPSPASLVALAAAPLYLCWIGAVSISSLWRGRRIGWLQVRRR